MEAMEITKIDNKPDPNLKQPSTIISLEEKEEKAMNIAEMEDELEAKGPSTTTSPGDCHELAGEEPDGEQTGEESLKYLHGLKLATIIAALCLAVFLVALDQTIISTAIPKITDRFESVDEIGW